MTLRAIQSLPWRSLLLTLLAAGVYLAAGPAPELWVYDRQGLANGQLWRLFSAHWVHSDMAHAGWDIGALLWLGWIFEPLLQRHLVPLLTASGLVIDAWLWWALPGLDHYCGLSGVLNALLAAGLWRLWRQTGHWVSALVAGACLLKLLCELLTGQALLTHTLWPSLPEAHALGLAAGLGYALCAGLGRRPGIGTLPEGLMARNPPRNGPSADR